MFVQFMAKEDLYVPQADQAPMSKAVAGRETNVIKVCQDRIK